MLLPLDLLSMAQVMAGLLPGALMRNASLKFVCREVKLEVTNASTEFTRGYSQGQIIRCPGATDENGGADQSAALARSGVASARDIRRGSEERRGSAGHGVLREKRHDGLGQKRHDGAPGMGSQICSGHARMRRHSEDCRPRFFETALQFTCEQEVRQLGL